MKALSPVLILAGTIVGALGGAKLPEADPLVTGIGLALLIAGIIVRRLAAAKAPAITGDVGLALEAIRTMPDSLEALHREAPDLPLARLVERLDDIERKHLRPAGHVGARLLGVLGSARFAEVMGAWAAAERLCNRTWSAAADGHRAEALASLSSATERVREAADALARE